MTGGLWTEAERDPAYWIARHERRKLRRGAKRGGGMVTLKLIREGRCRLCERTEEDARREHTGPLPVRFRLTRHHINPKSEGGKKNLADNVVPLCGRCHRLIDATPWPERVEHRSRLRPLFTEEEVAHVVKARGLAWLDRHYPADPNAWIGATEPPEGGE